MASKNEKKMEKKFLSSLHPPPAVGRRLQSQAGAASRGFGSEVGNSPSQRRVGPSEPPHPPPTHARTPSSLHHVHGVLREKGVDVAERRAQLAVSAPAAQHELVQTLRTDGRSAQVHLQDGQRSRVSGRLDQSQRWSPSHFGAADFQLMSTFNEVYSPRSG